MRAIKTASQNLLYISCLNKNFHFMYTDKGVGWKTDGVFTFC